MRAPKLVIAIYYIYYPNKKRPRNTQLKRTARARAYWPLRVDVNKRRICGFVPGAVFGATVRTKHADRDRDAVREQADR